MKTIILFLIITAISTNLSAQSIDAVNKEINGLSIASTDTIINFIQESEKANKKIARLGYQKHSCEKMASELWYKKIPGNQYSVLHIVKNTPFWTESITYESNRYFIRLLNTLEEMPLKSLYDMDLNDDFIITSEEYKLFILSQDNLVIIP